MFVSAILVTHDGERWLPTVVESLAAQTRPVDRLVAVDTGSTDASATVVAEAFGPDTVQAAAADTGYPDAVERGLAALGPAGTSSDRAGDEEWVWLLHDDASPAPDALEQLVAAARAHPDADALGPKLREWPSLRRLLELGLTITGTGHRETWLERGEYDQGQHDDVRRVLAVNTAGMLVRRSVLEGLGGLDRDLPIFGNDIDFGWRAAEAGHTTLVVPQAVVFHAEAAHRGVRRTPLTGTHTHYQERRAALTTLLANAPARSLPWRVVRLLGGSLLRALGFLLVRSPREAGDEVAALGSVYARPGRLLAARRWRARQRRGGRQDVRSLLAPVWLPYRHGLDAVVDVAQALTSQASDVAERRHEAKLAADPAYARETRARADHDRDLDEDDDTFLRDTGVVARFLTNPVALTLAGAVLLFLVAGRAALGDVTGPALSPVPAGVGDWWRLHLESWHTLGTGTDVPAPAYLLPLSLAATVLGGSPGLVVSALMWLAVPVALWGAWRLLRVVGHLVDPQGLPRWLLVWGAVTWALVPVTCGAWGEGRFGTVAVAALLPWLAHAALGLTDPDADRRWRAAWRTALLLALASAFVPAVWLFALLAGGLVLLAGRFVVPGWRWSRSTWGPPATALAAVPVLLAPWIVPLLTTGSAAGLLLEAGRLPVDEVDTTGLLTGRLLADTGLAAPWWLGAVVGALAVLALVPRATRVPVLLCWLVGLAAAVVLTLLSHVDLALPAAVTRPSLAFFVVVLQGIAVVAVVLGADAYVRRLRDHHPAWQRLLAAALAVVAALVPLGGLVWWLLHPTQGLADDVDEVVPAYMAQASLQGDEHGVLVVRGSIEEGLDYRIRRGDGITLGEDEVLALADVDPRFRDDVGALASAPTPELVTALGERGIEHVVLPAPADGQIAAGLDATEGLDQASAEDRATRAWKVDRPLDAGRIEGPESWLRPVLLVVQGLAVVIALVLAMPGVRSRRTEVSP